MFFNSEKEAATLDFYLTSFEKSALCIRQTTARHCLRLVCCRILTLFLGSYPSALKKTLAGLKIREVGDKILTNYAYDVYEMSPYLIEMKSWLVELDEQKKDKERPIII